MSIKKVPIQDEFNWQLNVKSRITVATLGGLSPSKGDRYILTDGANINKIATYNSATWDYLVALEGFVCWINDENLYYRFDGSNWSILVHTQGTDLGLDTGGTNPITASQIKNTFNNIIYNLLLAFFKLSVQAGLVVYNLIDGIMDEFEDESGVATKTNATYDSVNDLYSPTKTSVTLLDYMEYATDGAAQAAYVTDATRISTITQQQISSDDEGGLNIITPRNTFGQGFKVSTTDNISKFTFRLANFSSADGTLTGYIYSDDGNNYPNSVLATFSSLAVNTLPIYDTFTDYEFTGSFTPTIGTQYHIVLVVAGQTQGVIMFKRYTGGGYADGRLEVRDNGVWGVGNYSGNDTYFKIYQDVIGLNSYSEGTIKTQGSYSLKGIAVITNSLNKTLTRTIGSPIDLTGINQIKFDIYASRTGANIKIGIHDAGGTTSEKTYTVIDTNTWETVTWDISGVSDANKDAIDKIIITIINADAANTFYIDNMYAGENITLNMTLISVTTTAVATPTKSRIVLFEEDVDSITINTDLKAYMSRDGGTTYTQHTLVNEGNYDTSKRILASESIDISGQPSGTSMKWKVESLNNKDLKLHGVGVQWGD
jgi:hypothetical protein